MHGVWVVAQSGGVVGRGCQHVGAAIPVVEEETAVAFPVLGRVTDHLNPFFKVAARPVATVSVNWSPGIADADSEMEVTQASVECWHCALATEADRMIRIRADRTRKGFIVRLRWIETLIP